jgi:hypothetical protein
MRTARDDAAVVEAADELRVQLDRWLGPTSDTFTHPRVTGWGGRVKVYLDPHDAHRVAELVRREAPS